MNTIDFASVWPMRPFGQYLEEYLIFLMNLLISVFLIPTMYIISIDAGSISGYDTVMVRIFLPHLSERKYFLRLLTKHHKIGVFLWKKSKILNVVLFTIASFIASNAFCCLSVHSNFLPFLLMSVSGTASSS